jgi:hypothetical protein
MGHLALGSSDTRLDCTRGSSNPRAANRVGIIGPEAVLVASQIAVMLCIGVGLALAAR